MDRKIINQKQRDLRIRNNNAHTKKYERTKKGFLVRKYRNMRSRIEGIQKEKFHLYENKYLLEKQKFYSWALRDDTFHELFNCWEKQNYSRKLCPSVDRIDPTKGYELDNMEWVTHSENSRRGGLKKSKTSLSISSRCLGASE